MVALNVLSVERCADILSLATLHPTPPILWHIQWVALNSDMAITEGMRVEVMWPSIGGSLYKGRVTEATGYDNFSIAFDDGTTEANVVRARIVSYVAQKPQVPHSVSTSHGSTIIVDAIEDTTNTDAWLVAKVHQLDGPVESIHITVASIRDQGWGNTKVSFMSASFHISSSFFIFDCFQLYAYYCYCEPQT